LIAVSLPLGVWATGRMSTDAQPDPGAAVWDEFVGMWITCLPFVLFAFWFGLLVPPYWIVLPFIVFRALDILKPPPCRQLEQIHGGWGIMLDDVAAGIWGFLAIAVLLAVLLLFGDMYKLPFLLGN
jgi:phosphatidylglycerophosphatase A